MTETQQNRSEQGEKCYKIFGIMTDPPEWKGEWMGNECDRMGADGPKSASTSTREGDPTRDLTRMTR